MYKRTRFFFVLVLALVLLLSSCTVKPGSLDPKSMLRELWSNASPNTGAQLQNALPDLPAFPAQLSPPEVCTGDLLFLTVPPKCLSSQGKLIFKEQSWLPGLK